MGLNKLSSWIGPCSALPRRIDIGALTMNAVIAGAGRPIVFIHGLGWDHTLWGRQIERLEARYLVLAGDTRGHGGTDKPPGPYSVAQFVEDWITLFDKLDLPPVLIVGFSLGGMIAQQLALLHPHRVGALVLVSTTCRVPAVGREHMDQRLEAMEAGGPRAAAEVAARSVFSEAWRASHPEQLADFVRWRAAQDQVALRAVMRAVADFDVAEELSRLDVPTLAITALGDTLMPPDAQTPIVQLVAGAEHVKIADAGHMVSIEKPGEFDAVLDDFLARHWKP